MDEFKLPISPDLAAALSSANEKMLPLAAIAEDINNKIQPTVRSLQMHQEHFRTTQEIFNELGLQTKNLHSALSQYQNPLLNASEISAKWTALTIESDAFKQMRAASKIWKENFNFDFSGLTKLDFRIAVVTQELEQVIDEDPSDIAEKLLYKEIPEPSNDTESMLFEILNNQRKILENDIKILDEINESQTKNVNDKKSNKIHNSPTSYRNKTWYAEQIESNMIAMMITSIFAITIGVNPANTILFALLVSYLLKFLK